MVIAYLDNGKIVSVESVESTCRELGVKLSEFDHLKPLYRGEGRKKSIAVECDKCGAPIGFNDPDECLYVLISVCWDCRC